jgi:AMMECR1 domain-containing protein
LATRPLYEDIIINAKNAAFRDPRFNPLSLDEVGDLLVEITVLSPLKQMKFENIEKLLEYLQNNHP